MKQRPVRLEIEQEVSQIALKAVTGPQLTWNYQHAPQRPLKTHVMVDDN